MGSLGGGGRSGAALLLRPHRLGFKLAKNDDLALVPPDLPSFPADTDFNTVNIKNTLQYIRDFFCYGWRWIAQRYNETLQVRNL